MSLAAMRDTLLCGEAWCYAALVGVVLGCVVLIVGLGAVGYLMHRRQYCLVLWRSRESYEHIPNKPVPDYIAQRV
jgi:hypothetical protein